MTREAKASLSRLATGRIRSLLCPCHQMLAEGFGQCVEVSTGCGMLLGTLAKALVDFRMVIEVFDAVGELYGR